MGVAHMSWPDLANSEINDLFRDCVKAEMKAGPRNQDGAMSAVAAFIGVSPQLVKLRFYDHVTGVPRKKHIRERCWAFLDRIAERERAWWERMAETVEQQRQSLQLTLPLEGTPNAARDSRSVARRVARAASEVAAMDRAAGDYARARPRVK